MVVTRDAQGRGAESNHSRRVVHRLPLTRPGEEAIILVTDLVEATRYPAVDLLTVYGGRGGIERVV